MKRPGFPDTEDERAWNLIRYGLLAFHVLGEIVRRRGNTWVTWTASRT
jgi:hypothetical protein